MPSQAALEEDREGGQGSLNNRHITAITERVREEVMEGEIERERGRERGREGEREGLSRADFFREDLNE